MLDIIESRIFTLIKSNVSNTIKKKYPDLNFTTSDMNATNPKFPTVYIHMLDSPERGDTTEQDTIEAVYTTIQVDVTDNQKQSRASEVAKDILKIMKQYGFKASTMPFSQNNSGSYRNIARYSRLISNNDKIVN